MQKRHLTDEQAHEVCQMIEDGYNNTTIANKFNVSVYIISSIRQGKTYKEISKYYKLRSKFIDDHTVHEICQMIVDGYGNTDIAIKYGLSKNTISAIRHRKTHKNITNQYNMKSRVIKDDKLIHKICGLIQDGLCNTDIADVCNVSVQIVSRIRCGISYKKIGKKYVMSRRDIGNRIDSKTVHKICKMLEDKVPQRDIAVACNTSTTVVSDINVGRTYRCISSKYNINKNNVVIIDDELAHKICKMLEDGYRNCDISIDCNVTEYNVSNIRNGNTHYEISKQYKIARYRRPRKLDDDTIHAVCKMLQDGHTRRETAKKFKISATTIQRIVYSETYADIRDGYNIKTNRAKKNT